MLSIATDVLNDIVAPQRAADDDRLEAPANTLARIAFFLASIFKEQNSGRHGRRSYFVAIDVVDIERLGRVERPVDENVSIESIAIAIDTKNDAIVAHVTEAPDRIMCLSVNVEKQGTAFDFVAADAVFREEKRAVHCVDVGGPDCIVLRARAVGEVKGDIEDDRVARQRAESVNEFDV